MKQLSLFVLSSLALCVTNASAQTGADSCTTPDVIVGTGVFTFDNTAATIGADGQAEALCNQLGSTTVTSDVWFTWTAPTSGVVVVETCGITGIDTKIALYAGTTCPLAGSALACNDDNCAVGFQSNLTASVVAGNSYVIQLGLYPGQFPVATPGVGQFSVNIQIPPVNDSCATATALPGPGTYAVSNALATTGPEGQSEALCTFFGFTAVVNDIWFTYTPSSNGTVTVTTCGVPTGSLNPDSKIAVYTGAVCPTAGSSIACNDDACASASSFESTVSFPGVCGTTYLIQFGLYGGSGNAAFYAGDLSITEAGGTACATPATSFCDGSAAGTTCVACGNNGAVGSGCANSSFSAGGLLTNAGNASIGTDTLSLTASSITGPGLFFQASGLAGSPIAFGDGMLCAASGILRMGVVFPAAGSATYPGGLTPSPIHIAGSTSVGDTRHYQCWYRDAVAFCSVSTFNLTQGLTLTWIP